MAILFHFVESINKRNRKKIFTLVWTKNISEKKLGSKKEQKDCKIEQLPN
jgi:hypothetical protein